MFKQMRVELAALRAAAGGAYALFICPWHLHWGATKRAHQRAASPAEGR